MKRAVTLACAVAASFALASSAEARSTGSGVKAAFGQLELADSPER